MSKQMIVKDKKRQKKGKVNVMRHKIVSTRRFWQQMREILMFLVDFFLFHEISMYRICSKVSYISKLKLLEIFKIICIRYFIFIFSAN